MNKYSYLNLNQKMIKIRKKLPALMRKRYSEDVDYDFVKLDDINQFLTPALNKYGVDFDMKREIATQRDSLGNPIFLTQDGNLWRYEADLEICWTNADRPEEVISATIHLVGTNDVPDKAKGTAMTYGLKYYLLNKFNFAQNGDEDPDMRGIKPVKETPKEKAAEDKKESKKSEAIKMDTGKVDTKKADRSEADKEKQKQEPEHIPKKENKAVVVSLPDKKEETKKNAFSSVEEQLSFLQPEEEDISFEEEAEMEAEEPQDEGHEIGDGFQMLKEDEEVPFSDEEETCEENEAEETDEEEINFDVTQETETEKEAPDEEAKESRDTKIEKAKEVVCNFGFHNGKTLGTMLESVKGWECLKWIATRYNGGNVEMKEAAKLLVEAKAYMADAA